MGVEPLREETKNWMNKAEEDFGTSEDCIKSRRFSASAFFSQQAAEKALKALQIEMLGKFDRIHDLMALAGSLKAPEGVIECCIKLAPYYTATRYPDVGMPINEETAKGLLGKSREVFEWAKRTLKR